MMMMLFAEETQLNKSLEELQAKLDVSATPIHLLPAAVSKINRL
jgi:hypothetical protein